ncbi:carbonic anhydrase [Bacillus mesophilus]|uniref:carbonic anhydrase n=1 Tax=Bacillus mesophilus TaxID=1808955 RepID=A0A6M0Q4I0_9BACI|nr:carbonic anhydrase [Bacillus mesophilus]MBM7661349.1 carbonic anhydrase [Bacillus mesophilus]NEY71133.1 carbonic anhydrase [Bacillus mesophilus]
MSSRLAEIIDYNKQFVENKEYETFNTTKYPEKKMVILTCMDTRLVELLPKSMSICNGDAKIIKNAGALVSHPFGSVMRSILVAVYSLYAEEVFVIGHRDCGMTGMHATPILEKAVEAGVAAEKISALKHAGINIDAFLRGFESVEQSVRESVHTIKNHPLLPEHVLVHGLIIDPHSGELELIIDGNN